MIIVFNKETACALITPLQSGVASKVTVAATDGILIQAKQPDICIMTTYDLEKGVQLKMEAQVLEDGNAIINATKLIQTIRAMEDGDITLTVDDRLRVTISCGRSSHTMSALPADDFPEIPRLTSSAGFALPQRVLRDMMSKCLYAMGVNDQRPVLNGLFFSATDGHLDMVSCDSFKMAVCGTDVATRSLSEQGVELDFRFILPNKSVVELFKLLDDKSEDAEVTIYISRKNIIFYLNSLIFFSKLIEGEYVDYNRIIIRDHSIVVYADRERLLGALERAALITEEKVAGSVRSHVKLDIEGDTVKISAVSGAGSSYDELIVGHEGQDLSIAFNNRYLMDSLRACRAEMVKISMSSPLTSINIEPAPSETAGEDKAGESELFFLLPVRMKG